MPTFALVRDADGHVEAIGPEVPAAHDGQTVYTVADDSPTHGQLTYANGVVTRVDSDPPPPARVLSLRAWRDRFTLDEQIKYDLALQGYAADGATPLTPSQRAIANILNQQLHEGPGVNPKTARALKGCQGLVQLGVITSDRIPALTADVTDVELEG
jgi:hypothetical protein